MSRSPDMQFWGKHRLIMKRSAGGWWESCKIGPGPAPIETSEVEVVHFFWGENIFRLHDYIAVHARPRLESAPSFKRST